MANTVPDPVCGMDIDPASAAGTSEYQGVQDFTTKLYAVLYFLG